MPTCLSPARPDPHSIFFTHRGPAPVRAGSCLPPCEQFTTRPAQAAPLGSSERSVRPKTLGFSRPDVTSIRGMSPAACPCRAGPVSDGKVRAVPAALLIGPGEAGSERIFRLVGGFLTSGFQDGSAPAAVAVTSGGDGVLDAEGVPSGILSDRGKPSAAARARQHTRPAQKGRVAR
jgi:hypothetical protein